MAMQAFVVENDSLVVFEQQQGFEQVGSSNHNLATLTIVGFWTSTYIDKVIVG